MITVFYCSPTYKETLGLGSTITEYYTMTNDEAKTLRDYYEAVETGEAVTYGIFTSILGVAIKVCAAAIGFAIGSGVAAGIAADYFQSLDNDFDDVATSGEEINKIKCVFKYSRLSSNDGAYFLSSVKLV